ncbi:hypothetical protein ITI46_09170 [Streptomyces oryzae]|uniref:Secreted protein n=1 Tax=Streptomyces oryzae TaxID=1434886 RepID=A0ABS3X943_9ACTN|nr:hypothetical protein [Streptomyces oryzae]MBO8191844.1 hypothetical protein [Streptomyces oryzae]
MFRSVRRTAVAATLLAAVGGLGAIAAPANAAPAGTGSATAGDVSAKSIDRWAYCSVAPAGSLVLDYDTINDDPADTSVCWSGSGRAANPDQHGELRQVHTANNRGSLHLKTAGKEWDLPFNRNETHNIPQDTVLLGLSMNE